MNTGRPMIKNIKSITALIAALCSLSFLLTGCGMGAYSYPYDEASKLSPYSLSPQNSASVTPLFAKELAVTDRDTGSIGFETENERAAGLFDISGAETVFSKDVHSVLYPASTTKVMTALLALKNSDLEEQITVSGTAAGITESGATLLGVKAGDTMTMDQALNALLIYSANDVAIAIAEHIAGSIAAFSDMMNAEAASIGATNSHFVNPHGLHEEEHYTTAYDLYLIFNEAIKYQRFVEIISSDAYKSTYYDRNGSPKEIDIATTNLYIKGDINSPDNITVRGGKTGTTKAAGANLVLLSEDENGGRFISVILHDDNRETLYNDMTALLGGIAKG